VNVLHALPDPVLTLREIARVMKPTGRLVIATPMPHPKPQAVFHAHLRQLRSVPEWLDMLRLMPALLWVLGCNLVMLRKARFFAASDLEQVLKRVGMRVRSLAQTYAGQNLIVLAERHDIS
jgi:SAM-dependent methyltransferase